MVTFLCYMATLSTVYMTGVVWFAQLVHYPLLDRGEDFAAFAEAYQRRTLWVVTPALVMEWASAVLLVVLRPTTWTWSGLVLLATIWVLTCRYQIPLHLRLKRQGYRQDLHQQLVHSNLVRALFWSLRALVVLGTTFALT